MPASRASPQQPHLQTHKAVHFQPGAALSEAGAAKAQAAQPSPAAGKAAANGAAAAARPGADPSAHSSFNQLYSPGPGHQDSWTIEAQRTDRMPAPGEPGAEAPPGSAASGASMAAVGDSPLSLLGGAAAGSYTPASAGFLESARKVDALRGRLESLEAALKDMESRAVAQLDRSLQEKVLATAAKIVQKRFLADKELDQKLQKEILQTAIKVVNRRQAAAAAPGAAQAGPRQEAEADPTRKLEFGQGEPSGSGGADVMQYVAHIEQGLGEVVRRLEKKVDAVASLLDQSALELLEARMAGGLVQLEARLAAVEQAAAAGGAAARHDQRGAADAPQARLLERVAGLEAAMAEQGRAVTDLLAALSAAGPQSSPAAAQQVAAAAAAVQAAAAARAEAAAAAGKESAPEQPPAAQQQQRAAPAAAEPRQAVEEAQPAAELVQRRAGAARRSVLGDPNRSVAAGAGSAAPSGPATTTVAQRGAGLPRLKPVHSAGTAQQIAMATAREQLAKQAARAREEEEAESPAIVAVLHAVGWGLVVLLGLAAMLVGMVAMLVKSGRLTEADLAFLWERRLAR